MAHMIECLMIGGPLDTQIIEVNDQKNTLDYTPDLQQLELPPIAQDALQPTLYAKRHVYAREDATHFSYRGFY